MHPRHRLLTTRLATLPMFALASLPVGPLRSVAQQAIPVLVTDRADEVVAAMPRYSLRIQKAGFRFSLEATDGRTLAPAHVTSGLQIAAGDQPFAAAEAVELVSSSYRSAVLRVSAGRHVVHATVRFSDNYVRLSLRPEEAGTYRIVLRTAGMSPGFGLGDHAALAAMRADAEAGVERRSTDVTGFSSEAMRAGGVPGLSLRMISNFVIFPRHETAMVNVEPGPKIVRVTDDQAAQGSAAVREMPHAYWFVGPPETIYRSFLEVRNRTGYRVYEPKYEWFGVGWEAWGALAWETAQATVVENVDRYLDLGFPLRWMVVGSGFWPRADSAHHATTSFGMWDASLYPDPERLIDRFHRRGLKFIIGLRIAFVTDGPFAAEGVRSGFFLAESGEPKVFRIGFPRRPVYLLDASNAEAVRWYVELAGRWLDAGVDGFKEDLFGAGAYVLRDDKVDPVNAMLMDRGVFVMGRNAYLGSPADLHRYNDFNIDQTQDRGPLNGLVYAYSGFPNVYPDIVGGTFAADLREFPELRDARVQRYYMRSAVYAAVNPSMSMGFGPWNFPDPRVTEVALAAARLHERLHPYIYSAAVDASRTGFPHPLTPLPLAYPNDPEVYRLENDARRGYQWLVGESLLATPLFGDDYATADSRDVYLPAGRWVEYDTGREFQGPRTLSDYPMPVGRTPLFVGREGIVVERCESALEAHVYRVATRGSIRFHHPDGESSTITVQVESWGDRDIEVLTVRGDPVDARRDEVRLVFPIRSGTDYLVRTREAGSASDAVRPAPPVTPGDAARTSAARCLPD